MGVALAALCVVNIAAERPEWRARRRLGVLPSRRASGLIQASEWPQEPTSPAQVDTERLARSLRQLCGFMPKGRPARYAGWITKYAQEHGEDPFLLAALTYRLSRCKPDAETVEGVGLTAIQGRMYRANVRGRTLRYQVPEAGGFVEREKKLRHGFHESSLRHAEASIEWAAALLSMWREQHEASDAMFEQVPHRHHVAHFVWGDRVKSSRVEDRILTDRRRLLRYYGEEVAEPNVTWNSLAWRAPLDGAPRVVSGVPGDPRDGGERKHRGVDVEASFGEPVYAMAAGRVSFAGVDLPGPGKNEQLAPDDYDRHPRKSLGHGGRFVCVTHSGEGGHWLRSCYMHLEKVAVRQGQRVESGTPLGTVGRTGMVSSAPHLHLEIKSEAKLFNAREVLSGVLLGTPPVQKKRRRRKRSYAQR